MLSFPSLPTFPFPNFTGNSAYGATASDCAKISDVTVVPVVPCGFDRKHIEEVCGCGIQYGNTVLKFYCFLFSDQFHSCSCLFVFPAAAAALECVHKCSRNASSNDQR